MPRGNDSQAALVDLRGEYGAASGNGEDLISAVRLALTPELRTAMILPKDQDATDELIGNGGLDQADKKLDEGTVLDLGVRGDWVIVLAETEAGRTFKIAYPKSEFGLKAEKRGAAALVAEHSDDESMRAVATERMQAAADAAQAARDAEEAATKAREKATAKASDSK